MDLDLAEVARVFQEEAAESLASAEEALLGLENRPDDAEATASVFRAVHTIKGNALSFGFGAVADLAHALEDVLQRMRDGSQSVGAETVELLLRGLDGLREGIPAAVQGGSGAGPGYGETLDALRALAKGSSDSPDTCTSGREPPATVAAPRSTAGLRVEVARLDQLLDLSGEIAVALARLRQALESGALAAARDALEGTERLSGELQAVVMNARLVPVGPLFRRHLRTVRDLAASRSRLARLVIEGDDVEIDMSVAEQIRDPLTHMIRNSIDHGIEAAGRRRALGKDPCGTLTLRARREAGSIVVELEDDGAGLDRGRILSRARDLGLVGSDGVPPDPELLRFLFEPGFSTANRVSDVSGRGVGLDVVRRNVESLRGTVEIASRAGTGTVVSLRLPLTLAIIPGLLVEVADQAYVVPLDVVVECLDGASVEDHGRETGTFELRGERVPCVRLGRLFADAAPEPRAQVVVVRHSGRLAGLVVGRVRGESQAVVKTLGPLFRTQHWFSGGTIAGDGRVAPILDVSALVTQAAAGA